MVHNRVAGRDLAQAFDHKLTDQDVAFRQRALALLGGHFYLFLMVVEGATQVRAAGWQRSVSGNERHTNESFAPFALSEGGGAEAVGRDVHEDGMALFPGD